MQAHAVQLRMLWVISISLTCVIFLDLTSIVLCTDKKQKRKKGRAATGGNAEEALAIILFEDDTEQLPVNPDLPNLDAWRPGRVLQIGDARFSIVYNPPTAEKVPPKPSQVLSCHAPAAVMSQASEVCLTAFCCAQIQIFGGTIVGCPVVAAVVVGSGSSRMLCSWLNQISKCLFRKFRM